MCSKDKIPVTAFSLRLIPHIRQLCSDCTPASCLESCYLSAFSFFTIVIVIFIIARTVVLIPGRTRILWIIIRSYITHISYVGITTGILSIVTIITITTYIATCGGLSYWVLNAADTLASGYESLLNWWLQIILLLNAGTTCWTFAHILLIVPILLLCIIICCDLCVIIDLLNSFYCVLHHSMHVLYVLTISRIF